MNKSRFRFNRNDGLLAAALAAAALILLAVFTVLRGDSTGNYVVITVSGEIYGSYSLEEDTVIVVDTEMGSNRVRIEQGSVLMEDADCPDLYCVSKGKISHNGDTIVCLPHRLVVQIIMEQEEEAPYDIIAQ